MSLPSLDDRAPVLSGSSAAPESPSVFTDDLDGPLCALSVYLSVAERGLLAPELDRDELGQALQGAREQVAALAQTIAAACRASRSTDCCGRDSGV